MFRFGGSGAFGWFFWAWNEEDEGIEVGLF
jgi:hypothetical protein